MNKAVILPLLFIYDYFFYDWFLGKSICEIVE